MQHSNVSVESEPFIAEQRVPWLRMFSPHQIAFLIRSLDSQLLRIEHEQWGDERFLLYVFAVAGKVQAFQVALGTETLDSIADLYPAALAFEQKLQDQWGLVFLSHSEENPSA